MFKRLYITDIHQGFFLWADWDPAIEARAWEEKGIDVNRKVMEDSESEDAWQEGWESEEE